MKRLLPLLLFVFSTIAFGQTTTYKATVTWDDPLNPPGVTYKVDRADASDCTGTPVFNNKATGLTARTFVDQPITPGKYCYRIVATVSGADSASNPTATGIVPAFAPSNIGISITLTITP
jgi:hypothetical protein